jgi:hypothetical protein
MPSIRKLGFIRSLPSPSVLGEQPEDIRGIVSPPRSEYVQFAYF